MMETFQNEYFYMKSLMLEVSKNNLTYQIYANECSCEYKSCDESNIVKHLEVNQTTSLSFTTILYCFFT